jgi:hypothetical protein
MFVLQGVAVQKHPVLGLKVQSELYHEVDYGSVELKKLRRPLMMELVVLVADAVVVSKYSTHFLLSFLQFVSFFVAKYKMIYLTKLTNS